MVYEFYLTPPGEHCMRDRSEVSSRIVRHRVIGDYLAVRAADRSLYVFYRPSFIGYSERSYRGQGVAAVIIGGFLMLFGYLVKSTGSSEGFGGFIALLLLFFGFVVLIIGIAVLFSKERFFTIESIGGTVVQFKEGGIADRDIMAILSQLSGEKLAEDTEKAGGSVR